MSRAAAKSGVTKAVACDATHDRGTQRANDSDRVLADASTERWDEKSEVVARGHEASLEVLAVENLLALAQAESIGEARQVARSLSEGPQAAALEPLLQAMVARAGEVEQLRRLAGRDELTGLANRRTFNDALDRELARGQRSCRVLSVLVMDLDHLKTINDRFGHPAGDRALCALAQSAEASVRDGDVVARLGGDEFAVVLPETERDEALAIGERIRRHLAEATARGLPLGLSLGAASLHGSGWRDPDPADRLLRDADRALYRDKLARRTLRPPASTHGAGSSR